MSRGHSIVRGVQIPMRDGVSLVADLYLPDGDGPWPVLLERLPYDRTSSLMTHGSVGLEGLRTLDAGFALVIQDTRGRYGSEGSFTPFFSDGNDAEDTLAWILRQAWARGVVGMFGGSYIGATQMLAAARAPRGLLAIAPQLTASEYYDGWTYSGGAFQLGFTLLWIIESLAGPDIRRRTQCSDQYDLQGILNGLLRDPTEAFNRLPVDSDAIARIAPYFRDWVTHDSRDNFWEEVDPSKDYNRMDVAALHVAGWYDIFLAGSLKNYVGMRSGAASDWARDRQYLIIGPWSHGNLGDWQGDDWLGYSASLAALDLTAIHLDFFRSVLGGDLPNMPRVRYFTNGAKEWREAAEWPIPAVDTLLYLGGDGAAATANSGSLTMAAPLKQGSDEWTSDPSHPVPTVGGNNFLPGLLLARNSGPKEQASIEGRLDVAVYTSSVLAENVEITGEVRVVLFASTDATDCDWVTRLVDVAPNGSTRSVLDGILRAKFREGLDRSKPVEPREVVAYTLTVGATSHTFLSGHRIRLQVCSSNFPRFDRNPQRHMSVSKATLEDFFIATQRVFHGGQNASRVILPVVSGRLV